MWYLHESQKIHGQPSPLVPPLNVGAGGVGGVLPGGAALETEDGRVLETEDGQAIKIEQ